MKQSKLNTEARQCHYWSKLCSWTVLQRLLQLQLLRPRYQPTVHQSQVNPPEGDYDITLTSIASPKLSGPSSPKDEAGILSPTGFAVSKDEDLANGAGDVINGANQDEPSAADYNPTMDMQEDQMRNDQRHHAEGDLSRAEVVEASQISAPRPDQAEGSKDDFDMFADEDGDDMFAEQPMKKPLMGDLSQGVKISKHKELDMSMLDDTNDPEGYYRVVLGEVLEGRYQVQANLGKGMFSSVVRASDSQTKRLVAIKMIRKNETMYVQALETMRQAH